MRGQNGGYFEPVLRFGMRGVMYNVKLTFQPFSMQKDLLSEVPLGERVHRENDVLAAAQHYWVPSADPQEWYRIHSPDDAQIQDHGEMNSIPVQAAQYRKVHRGRFARLFKKEPEANQIEVPLTQSDKYELLERQQKARSALLVWANQAGVHLDQGKLEQLFGTASEQTELENGMRLAWGTKQPSSTEERQQIERVREMGDRLIVELSKHGQVVADLQAEGAKRICVCLKQHHTDNEINPMDPKSLSIREIRAFLGHQNSIFRLQQIITSIVGLQKIQFFIEGLSRDGVSWQKSVTAIQNHTEQFLQVLRKYVTGTEDNACFPEETLQEITSFFERGEFERVARELRICSGEQSYVEWSTVQQNNLSGRVHGLGLPAEESRRSQEQLRDTIRKTAKLDCDDATFERLIHQPLADWFDNLHPFLMSELNGRIDEVGVVVLGAKHFRSGLIMGDNEVVQGKKVEDYYERQNNLRDLRLIVVEPRHLADLCAISDDKWYV